jgi:FtsZ-binding cell division protein ZapB
MAMRLGQFFVFCQNLSMDIKKALDFITPQGLKDIIKNLQERINDLLNDNSELNASNEALKKKNEELENRIRLLLGEKPRPDFSGEKNKDRTAGKHKNKDNKDRSPRRKKLDLQIDKTQFIAAPAGLLDSTYEYKGTRKVIIQEMAFNRENICFEIERFYSSEYGRVVEGHIPAEYQGYEFGPRVRAFILHLFYHGDCTHNKIRLILKGIGIKICNQTINNILLENYSDIENELEAKRVQAIEKYQYQHIDDTGAKVLKANGSCYTYVCSNPEFTSLYTIDSKGRSAAVDALTRAYKRLYKLNFTALDAMASAEGSFKLRILLRSHIGEKIYDEVEVENFLRSLELGFHQTGKLRTAMHIGAMADGHLGIAGRALISDDASNFKNLFKNHCLCWVHELRHYKLIPVLYEHHAEMLVEFLMEAWKTVSLIEDYQQKPTGKLRKVILRRIDQLFINPSAWVLLDKQKKLTASKLDKLLYPLINSVIPTNNNLAERDLRGRIIKRKISLFNQTLNGARRWDFWYSLKETTRKLGLNFWEFIEDRLFLRFKVPALTAVSIH